MPSKKKTPPKTPKKAKKPLSRVQKLTKKYSKLTAGELQVHSVALQEAERKPWMGAPVRPVGPIQPFGCPSTRSEMEEISRSTAFDEAVDRLSNPLSASVFLDDASRAFDVAPIVRQLMTRSTALLDGFDISLLEKPGNLGQTQPGTYLVEITDAGQVAEAHKLTPKEPDIEKLTKDEPAAVPMTADPLPAENNERFIEKLQELSRPPPSVLVRFKNWILGR